MVNSHAAEARLNKTSSRKVKKIIALGVQVTRILYFCNLTTNRVIVPRQAGASFSGEGRVFDGRASGTEEMVDVEGRDFAA